MKTIKALIKRLCLPSWKAEGYDYKKVTADELVEDPDLRDNLFLNGWRRVPEATTYGFTITYTYAKKK